MASLTGKKRRTNVGWGVLIIGPQTTPRGGVGKKGISPGEAGIRKQGDLPSDLRKKEE